MSYVTGKLELGDWVRRTVLDHIHGNKTEYREVVDISSGSQFSPRVVFLSVDLMKNHKGDPVTVSADPDIYPDDGWEIVGPIAPLKSELTLWFVKRKIEAIKLLRARTNCGLMIAKYSLEHFARDQNFSPKDQDEGKPFVECPKCEHIFPVDFGLFPIEPIVLEDEDEEENQEA